MEIIYDWKGNVIKPGMTIYFVQTEPMALGRFGVLIPGQGLRLTESEEDYEKRKNQKIWELGRPWVVSENNGRLVITTYYENDPDIESLTTPLMIPLGENQAIAIKGISDAQPLIHSL